MTVSSDKPTAIVYCRVSTKSQQEEGTSLESQASACVRHAEQLGYSVDHITEEVFTGAELWDRPALSRDLAIIREKRFKALICYSIDRLSRDPVHLAIIASECERSGTELIFVTESLDNSPEGALIRYINGYVAQLEREKMKERSLRGKREKLLRGKLVGSGVDKYGYRHNKETGTRDIYEPEAQVVRQIYRWIIEDRIGVQTIVERLREAGIPSPSVGKREFADGRIPKWVKTQVLRILHDPDYKGETVCWRWKTVSRKKFVLRPEEEHIRLPEGVTPAIVDGETWNKVQVILGKSKTRQHLQRTVVTDEHCQ